jgi:hypothetical protein
MVPFFIGPICKTKQFYSFYNEFNIPGLDFQKSNESCSSNNLNDRL